MPLSAGDKLGPYEILVPIGAGGMGEVWKARDTRLNRTVAIKTSHQQFNERFEREARAVAALNHPNVCILHDIGPDFLVMEYVEGSTLAHRIEAGPVPLAEALNIARQIVEALEAAHEKGITHRDLKPENVKITPDGIVKVLDFGLAALPQGPVTLDPASAPTVVAATVAGTIMGTPGYMSPEQAAGKTVDRRTDIWAFGVVLWEMLSGRKLFEGETLVHTLAEVVNGKIDLENLPKDTPPTIHSILQRCLDRDVKTRLQWIGEARVAIQKYQSDPTPAAPVALAHAGASKGWRRWTFLLFAVAMSLVAAAVIYWQRQSASPEPITARFLLMPPDGTRFYGRGEMSPNGKHLAVVAGDSRGERQIWIRDMDTTNMRPLPGTEQGTSPFWSPDSRSIAFAAGGRLRRVDHAGGPVQTIFDSGIRTQTQFAGGAWGANGVILFAVPGQPLYRVMASGGTPVPALTLDQAAGDTRHRFPRFLPDGRHFLYSLSSAPNRSGVYLATLDSNEQPRNLLPGAADAAFAADTHGKTGFLFFRRGESLMAVRMDWGKAQLAGEPIVALESLPGTGGLPVSASVPANVMVWAARSGRPPQQKSELATLDRSGRKIAALPLPDRDTWRHLELSPDGGRVMADRLTPNGESDIWTVDLARGVISRLTSGNGEQGPAVFLGDGRRILYSGIVGGQRGIYTLAADGSGRPELLLKETLHHLDVTPDGKHVVYEATERSGGGGQEMRAYSLEKGGKPEAAVSGKSLKQHPHFSPDGRWLAYSSDETGQPEIYVQSFPSGSGRWQVSSKGGVVARWRRDGRELVFREVVDRGSSVYSVSVTPRGNTLEFGAPQKLFTANFAANGYFTMSADAQRFYAVQLAGPETPAEDAGPAAPMPLIITLNWAAGLKK
ncbi:MAG: serine/threonine-protein kinase [Acidobacteria bacterium]|nr:serine/threonine-protein kinase [Acidobacteriota bacterium]